MLLFIARILTALVIAIAGGAASVVYVLDASSGVGNARNGAWISDPVIGTGESNPYTRARVARNGQVYLGALEGRTFTAVNDSTGAELDGACTYLVRGETIAARYWTFAISQDRVPEDQKSSPFARNATHSRMIVRQADGSFVIAVSPLPQPGNWVRANGRGDMRFVLTLYDMPQSASRSADAVGLPQIVREHCDA